MATEIRWAGGIPGGAPRQRLRRVGFMQRLAIFRNEILPSGWFGDTPSTGRIDSNRMSGADGDSELGALLKILPPLPLAVALHWRRTCQRSIGVNDAEADISHLVGK